MDKIGIGDKIPISASNNYNNFLEEQNKGKILISEKKEDFNKHFYYEIRSTSNSIIFDYILFKNFYVASISLIAFCGNESFCLLNNYTLMNDANTEEDSERYIIISSKEFEIDENKFKELKINSLKLYIFQPSLLWNCFYLKNLKIINSINNTNLKQKIYYEISPKNKYIFKEENMDLIDDSEVINQKYIEIASKGGNLYSKLSFID